MRTYPEEFPAPNHSGISGEVDVGLQRTSVPAPLASQEKLYNSPTVEMSLTFGMDNPTFVRWVNWMNANGHEWFLMDIVSPFQPVDILSEHQVRRIGDIEHVKAGDNWNTVSVPFEILPGDKEDANAPAATYDWIVAGAPASPAADWIVAGTPASPADDWVLSHLYYY